MRQVGFIGAGNMAGAILRAMVAKEVVPAGNIHVYDKYPAAAEKFAVLGCHPVTSLEALLDASDTLFFCVKPNNLGELLADITALGGVGERLLVSIVTGKPAPLYMEAFGESTKLVLVMPNTPLLVGCGASAVARGFNTTEEEFTFASGVFHAAGEIGVVTPELLPDMVAVNGSTPAFLYRYAKVAAEHAAEIGVDYESALRLIAATMAGSAKMLLESGFTPDELIRQVSSPGGTTIAGLAALDETGFDKAIVASQDAAARRAHELAEA